MLPLLKNGTSNLFSLSPASLLPSLVASPTHPTHQHQRDVHKILVNHAVAPQRLQGSLLEPESQLGSDTEPPQTIQCTPPTPPYANAHSLPEAPCTCTPCSSVSLGREPTWSPTSLPVPFPSSKPYQSLKPRSAAVSSIRSLSLSVSLTPCTSIVAFY